MGHEVLSVEGAVAAAARTRPDLILVDECLRPGSGLAAIERILRDGFIPHVWMRGDSLRRASLATGVAVLQKPFTVLALGLAIAQVCKLAPSVASAGESLRAESDERRTRG